MKNNYNSDFEIKDGAEYKKTIINKHEDDLFDEEKDVVERLVRVKRTSLPNNGERWKIFVDGKVVFTIEGTKISKREKEFLRTSTGFSFLIAQCKAGIKSLNSLRSEIKKVITKQ